MAKFQIIFLSVLVFMASQANAGPFSTNMTQVVGAVKDQVVTMVNKTTGEVKEIVSKLNDLVMDTFKSAKEVAEKSNQKLTDEYNQMISEVGDIINSNSILSPECQDAVSAFQNAYKELKGKSNECMDKRIQSSVQNLNKINELSNEVQADLHQVRNDAIECASNISGLSSFFQALKCVNIAAVRATWIVGQKVPVVTFEAGKLGANILLLPPQIAFCYSTQFISTFGTNYRNSMKKLNQCIINRSTDIPTTTADLRSSIPNEIPSIISSEFSNEVLEDIKQ